MEDSVSIIVPIYNVEKYLKKCFDSLISQTYNNIRIYAVIDGSPDNSLEIVHEYMKNDSRFVCVNKENGGYGSALDTAISMIESEYFLICDPDDWLANNCIEELYKKAKSNNLDICVGDKFNVYVDDESFNYSSTLQNNTMEYNRVYEGDDIRKFVDSRVSPHSKLYRTSICKDIVFEHKVSYTDFTLFLVALDRSKRVCYIDKPLSYYLCDRPGNTATDRKPQILNSYIKVWYSTFEQLDKSRDGRIIYKMYEQFKHILTEYSMFEDKQNVRQYYEDIVNMLSCLAPYSNKMFKLKGKNKKSLAFMYFFLNKISRNFAIKMFLFTRR